MERSLRLLPTPAAHYAIGKTALRLGDRRQAVEHLRAAASAGGRVGEAAFGDLARLELPSNPGGYLRTGAALEGKRVVALVENPTPLTVRDVQLRVELRDRDGDLVSIDTVRVWQPMGPGSRARVVTGIVVPKKKAAGRVSVEVLSARIDDRSGP